MEEDEDYSDYDDDFHAAKLDGKDAKQSLAIARANALVAMEDEEEDYSSIARDTKVDGKDEKRPSPTAPVVNKVRIEEEKGNYEPDDAPRPKKKRRLESGSDNNRARSVREMTADEYIAACIRLDKFMQRLPNGCVSWTGGKVHDGYGQVSFLGQPTRAHRAVWMLANSDEIPPTQVVRHQCNNPGCVNPDHLEIGTRADNYADTIRDGVAVYGEKTHNSKLTKVQVLQIVARVKAGEKPTQLAAEFKVHRVTITSIASGKLWSIETGIPRPPKKKRKPETFVTPAYVAAAKQRFTKKIVVLENGHWQWTGSVDKYGYGANFRYNRRTLQAHVAALLMYSNLAETTPGQIVRHGAGCEPSCCNPTHLCFGTPQDNADDRAKHGTQSRGSQHQSATITEEIARQIKLSKGQGTQRERAERFGVSYAIVWSIDFGRTWAHVT
jgi:hypothetical protein